MADRAHAASVLAVLTAVVIVCLARPVLAHNTWAGEYRKWPWRAGQNRTLTTLPGECPHCPGSQSSSAWKAIDAGLYYETVYSVGPGAVERYEPSGGGAGIYLRIKDSDGTYITYEHLKSAIVRSGSVVAGQPIAVSGCTGNCNGAHLHFQRADAPSFSANARDLVPISGHGGSGNALSHTEYLSDNAGLGYGSDGAVSTTMQTVYAGAGGYNKVGATAELGSLWSPCRADGGKSTWWRYGCSPRSGIAGSVQTFFGPGEREHAIMHKSGASASYILMRGILGAYTELYNGHDYVYWMGYPTGNRFVYQTGIYRQNFEHGHIYFWPDTCREKVYLSTLAAEYDFCD